MDAKPLPKFYDEAATLSFCTRPRHPRGRRSYSGMLTTVRVLAVRETSVSNGASRSVIDVVNERTGRRTTFRSAARLRCPAAGAAQEA